MAGYLANNPQWFQGASDLARAVANVPIAMRQYDIQQKQLAMQQRAEQVGEMTKGFGGSQSDSAIADLYGRTIGQGANEQAARAKLFAAQAENIPVQSEIERGKLGVEQQRATTVDAHEKLLIDQLAYDREKLKAEQDTARRKNSPFGRYDDAAQRLGSVLTEVQNPDVKMRALQPTVRIPMAQARPDLVHRAGLQAALFSEDIADPRYQSMIDAAQAAGLQLPPGVKPSVAPAAPAAPAAPVGQAKPAGSGSPTLDLLTSALQPK